MKCATGMPVDQATYIRRSMAAGSAASFRAGKKTICRKLAWRGELLRNARVYFGKPIHWLAQHPFEIDEECSC
jgi:hypothetical protein